MDLIEKIQSVLLNTSRRNIDRAFCNNPYGSYIEQAANRLISEYQIVINKQQPTADFYVALRSFIGAVKTPLGLPDLLSDDEMIKRFSLVKLADNRYDISRKYPQVCNASFINRVFDHQDDVTANDSKYMLYTSPFIYQGMLGQEERRHFKNASQQLSVNAALSMKAGNTALICMPTGSGKSMITQALALQQEDGLTVVIVPTISLAIDQEKEAQTLIANCNIGEVYSYHGGMDANEVINALHSHKTKLLFISPEALQINPKFKEEMDFLSKSGYLKNLVIDEAHMVVEWGSAFRMDYQTLESFRNRMLHNNKNIRTYLLSATYDRHEIAILKSLFSKDKEWLEIRCDALRGEILFDYIQANNALAKQQYSNKLIDLLPRPMIIYVRRPIEAENLKNQLAENGYVNIRTFTGETNKNMRDQIIDEWKNNQFSTMIATSAFGIGVDKRDVRTVLHLHIPENPNLYYQEVGRGGRDAYPSLGVMCVNPKQDLLDAHNFASRILSEDKLIERWFSMLKHAKSFSQGADKCVSIDTSVLPEYSKKGDELTGNQMHIKWNVYVLMLLRRYDLIEILDVNLKNKDTYDEYRNIYIVQLRIKVSKLLDRTPESEQILKGIRKLESDYYEQNYRYVADCIKRYKTTCWSEMFFEVFDKVDMFCPGCNIHAKPFGLIRSANLPLKKKINSVSPNINSKLNGFIGPSREAYIKVSNDLYGLVKLLVIRGVKGLIVCGSKCGKIEWYEKLQADPELDAIHIAVFNVMEYKHLYDHEDWYYFDGDYLIIYGDSIAENQVALEISQNVRKKVYGFNAIHVSETDFNFGSPNRHISECIEGQHYDDSIVKGVLDNV